MFGLIILLMNRSLSFLFFLLFFFYFSDFIWFMWKKRSNGNGENERMRGKKNPDERERIDKISSWYNILIQEIQLLMYSSSSYLLSYCSLAKKKSFRVFWSMNSRYFEHFLSIFCLCTGCWRCSSAGVSHCNFDSLYTWGNICIKVTDKNSAR